MVATSPGRRCGKNIRGGNAQQVRLLGPGGDETPACLGRVSIEFVLVLTPSPDCTFRAMRIA